MRLPIIATIAGKELRESLRDRRTLFLMVFLPILLYPALLVLISQVTLLKMSELEQTEVTIGFYEASLSHPVAEHFDDDDAIRLIEVQTTALTEADAVIDFADWPDDAPLDSSIPVRVHFESVDDLSNQARDRAEAALSSWVDLELSRRLEAEALAEAFIDPLDYDSVNQSDETAQGGFVLAALLPLLVLVTVLMGAYYPAIDLTAGEKERGTIQTLFTAPVSAMEIVTGKYVAVVGIACVSGGANLISMMLVMGQNLLLNDDIASNLDLSVSFGAFLALGLTILCIALLFSALMMAVAVLARSFKEAQTYVTPVYLICILPAMVAQLPGFEYTPAVGLIPAVGPILLMRALLMTGVDPEALLLVCGSTVVYALLTLAIAARLFGQESVIVGERGGVQLIPRRSQLKPLSRPPLEAAIAWFCVLFVLFFYVGSALQTADLHWGLVGTLWGVMLAPTVALSAWAKWNLNNTFSTRTPAARLWPAALVLAVSGVVVVGVLNVLIESLGLRPPTAYLEQMSGLVDSPSGVIGWAAAFFVLAITPAICEEFVFRGFLLSSLKGRVNDWAAIAITAVLFGLFHLDVYRLFGTTALGILLGYLTLRTKSILPAVAMHAINNGIAVALMAAGAQEMDIEFTPAVGLLIASAGIGLVWSLKTLSKTPRD